MESGGLIMASSPFKLTPLPTSCPDTGGRSQVVVGKSRTTGSIYLTSVSSTIAKHHQRAAGPLQTRQGSSGGGDIQIDTRSSKYEVA
ncbi:hypothetical protein KUCAC02_006628 [Chaenocephalus aceratus]|uniref:Uncharacterized protein n=1 Tax=Chaenocephalus aceratus TaxID=36190 RepID=A0ACB9VSW9_CHAAC|nr:hypothetical protein KUCAC02_006628 [Chaenocephalus aceratus]